MDDLEYTTHERISLKDHPKLNERWLQERIAEDPSILGLGELIVKDRERRQPGAGRLDILLQDPEENIRYELEIQLGRTDESHIIRTIEYWDIERKRFPQYDHIAVIAAEDITSRFLNVIGLFNGVIPLIAIQLSAIRIADQMTVVSTTVLDQRVLGFVEEDEEETVDRSYWENRASPETVAMADRILEIARSMDSSLELKYNKFYIGMARSGLACNFVIFRPRRQALRMEVRLKQSEELEERLDSAGLDLMNYDSRNERYRIRLTKGEISEHSDLISELLAKAYEDFGS